MRKSRNYIMCLFLLCCMMVSAAVPVYAAGMIDTEKDISLTISYRNDEIPIAGAEFDIYRIADTDAYARMTLTERFAGYPITLKGNDQTGWDALAETLKGYVWTDSLTADFSGKTDAEGILTASFKPGLYLVMSSRITIGSYIYSSSPYLVFLPSLDQEKNSWDYNTESYPKVSFEKKPSDGSGGKTVSRSVIKVWNDSGKESSRPEKVTVHLMCDGKVVDTVTLNADNNWRYSWSNLERNHDWLVTEDAVSGYTQTITQDGNVFTVRNTINETIIPDDPVPTDKTEINEPDVPLSPAEPVEVHEPSVPTAPAEHDFPKLPQTGLLWWPVPVLLSSGLLCIAARLVMKKNEEDRMNKK